MSENVAANLCPKCHAPIPAEAPQGLCPKCVLAGAAAGTEGGAPATATAEIPTLSRIAAAFPQLEIIELIGRGGMGFVFKARQPHLDRFVALKLLPDKLAKDPHFAERFNREGRVLAKLNHPNIVSVFDFGQAGGFYYLMMEYVDGVNLRQAMQAGRFSPAEALAIVPRICEALQYAHEQGVLHRDIKPENILLDAKGRVKIADFGIAKLVGEDAPTFTLTGTGAALGTPHYMAPEQLEKPGEVDHRADIYSLGVVFYEMLTGELPIGRFAPPSARTPLDRRVDDIVMRALEKERELRQKNATEVKTQVEHVASTPAPPLAAGAAGPHGTIVTTRPPAARVSWKAILGAVLVGMSILIEVVVLALGISGLMDPPIVFISVVLTLPAMAGTVFGWLAVFDIRARPDDVNGLPLAVFAALAWPLLVLAGVTIGIPYFVIHVPTNAVQQPSLLARTLALIVPAGVLTFAVWSVYATARWAGGHAPNSRRGVLKWVFLGLLLGGFGYLLVTASWRGFPSSSSGLASGSPGSTDLSGAKPDDTNAWIRFTFTAVELREDAKGQWLAFDYVDDVHGRCERAFGWNSTIPGFKPQTRASAFATDAKDDSPSVRHQRFEVLLPPVLDRANLLAFRDEVARRLVAKSMVIRLGESKPLFLLPVPGRGELTASFQVVTPKSLPATRTTEAEDLIVRAAEEKFAAVQQQHNSGAASFEEFARAERDLAMAKARGDAAAVARAQLLFTEQMLAQARKLQAAGLISQTELRKAEADHAVAVAEARGDKVAVAQATLTFAEWALERARKQHEAGIISATQLRQAEVDRAEAELALQRALKNQPKPK